MTGQRFGRVGLLYGGTSSEREVSLMSGQAVHQALLNELARDNDLVITQGAGSVSKLVALLAEGGFGLGLATDPTQEVAL